ncbi:SH3 domain-containing protein 1-like isoform X1 [Actinidia eriantha]|uniref:SH3 domain-containing protein 1-like isoform X1 n=1 Tax=Actinidia eriantha TaxID=165200 RepID=UPI002582D68B|nr:SH3 domain-containing protein 1-like isoform X1 [Actinidia eriantha]
MEAIKKQASKLREQVAKQQQAVLGQLGHLGNEDPVVDDTELQCHQQLQSLYNSTRAAKHFQRDIVRGVEGFISTSKKQMDIARKLAEDCCKYGTESQSVETPLARAALRFGTSHRSMENDRESMLQIFCSQVSEPLRASIKGAPLEDARHLTHRYDRLRQEVEAQVAEVIRRQLKCNPSTSAESSIKLQSAERKLNELRSAMMALGREAIAAMSSVEDEQQRITFLKLLTMVDAEKSYHQNVVSSLDELHSEMILEKQLNGSSSQSVTMQRDVCVPPVHDDPTSNGPDEDQDDSYYIAKVIHSFDAEAEGELSLSVDDYVVVRQVAHNGWSEGECKGNAGWFPSAYVERQDKAPASKITEATCSP